MIFILSEKAYATSY